MKVLRFVRVQSISRMLALSAFWPGLKPGKWTVRNQSPEGLIRISLLRIFEIF